MGRVATDESSTGSSGSTANIKSGEQDGQKNNGLVEKKQANLDLLKMDVDDLLDMADDDSDDSHDEDSDDDLEEAEEEEEGEEEEEMEAE